MNYRKSPQTPHTDTHTTPAVPEKIWSKLLSGHIQVRQKGKDFIGECLQNTVQKRKHSFWSAGWASLILLQLKRETCNIVGVLAIALFLWPCFCKNHTTIINGSVFKINIRHYYISYNSTKYDFHCPVFLNHQFDLYLKEMKPQKFDS